MNLTKVNLQIIFFLMLFFENFGLANGSWAATTYTCDGSDSNSPAWPTGKGCQAAINYASDGDTVSIPAGTYTWNTGLTIDNKNVTVIGAGKDVTFISSGNTSMRPFTISITTKASWRVSGMTFDGTTAPWQAIFIYAYNAPAWTYGWRIDNIKLNYSVAVQNDPIFIQGVTYGLIDHCDFAGYGNIYIAIYGYVSPEDGTTIGKLLGTYNLSLPLDLGTYKAVYVEDCTFAPTSTTSPAGTFDTDFGGMRIVFRHNTVTGCYMYAHWTQSGSLGVGKYEIYNNLFDGNNSPLAPYPGRFESGTGVIFNNTMKNYSTQAFLVDERRACNVDNKPDTPLLVCDGTHTWDGNFECADGTAASGPGSCAGGANPTGWPCLTQIGRGTGAAMGSLPSVPMYAWNNGIQDGCRTGGVCTDSVRIGGYGMCGNESKFIKGTAHFNGDVDYVNNGSTPKPGYTPYTYPHPLQGVIDTTPPAAPTGLAVN